MINSVYGTLRGLFNEDSKMYYLLGLMAWNSGYRKPKKLECLLDFIHELEEKTNSELKGAEISAFLPKRNGYIEFNINFDKKEPDFLNEQDKERWYSRLMEVAKKEFGMNHVNEPSDLYRMGIPLSADELGGSYRMSGISLISLFIGKNLNNIVKKGFEQTKNYINWYLEEVEKHNKYNQLYTNIY